MPLVKYPKPYKKIFIGIGVLVVAAAIVTGVFLLVHNIVNPTPKVKPPVYPTNLKVKIYRPKNLSPEQTMQYNVEELTMNHDYGLAVQEGAYYAQTAPTDDQQIYGLAEEATAYSQEGDYQAALQVYLNAQQKYGSDNGIIENGIALTAQEAGQNATSIAAYQQLINLSKGNTNPLEQANVSNDEAQIQSMEGK